MNDLENQEQEFNDLLKIAGHTLHTPLAAIQQAAKIMIFESEGSPNAHFLNDLYEIRDSADQLSDFLDRVWHILQVDERFLHRTAVDPRSIVENVLVRANTLSNTHIISQMPLDLPPVVANADALEEAVFILITRIIRTISELDIYLSATTNEQAVIVSIATSQQATFNARLGFRDFLHERENLSLPLFYVWRLIHSQSGTFWLTGEANSPNVNFQVVLPTNE
jgi:light-regulated signal transduction histidine kinase (bacteriophytochrome)